MYYRKTEETIEDKSKGWFEKTDLFSVKLYLKIADKLVITYDKEITHDKRAIHFSLEYDCEQ